MRFKKVKPIFLFVSLCLCFFVCGSLLFPFASALEHLFPLGAVFAASSPSMPEITLFSALPLSLSEKADVKEPEASVPKASASPVQETYATYASAPAETDGKLQIKNSTSYTFDAESLLNAPFPLTKEGPKVLILHTHTSEAYAESPDYSYIPSDAYRTEDPAFNICLVGQALKNSLEENGISAVHDTTSHDYPSYSGCYGRSLETIEKNLSMYPSIEVVIDVHRDAISASDGTYLKTAAEVDGKTAAQVLVVVGTDAGGLAHPEWQKNLSLGLKVQKTLCDMYPGLARPLHLRTERFNGHAMEGALLIEIGSNGNTMKEALYSATLVGDALSKTLLSLMQ